jgi:methylthioribulose-1-phosphate dehydratase
MMDQETEVRRLVPLARELYERGWMWGTSGNLSVLLSRSPLTLAITGSGASKGALALEDIAVQPAAARSGLSWLPPARGRPSAETAIHEAVYHAVPEARAVLHVHTVASTALSLDVLPEGDNEADLPVERLEMLKGWGVNWRFGRLGASIPVLANRESMEDLGAAFASRLSRSHSAPMVLVAGHGMTVWGATVEEARNRLEVAEFLCQVLWERRRVRS